MHRLNRDIAEALSRIGEKITILNTIYTGRDTNLHRVISDDMKGLNMTGCVWNPSYRVLISDSATLQVRYQDKNGQHVALQQNTLLKVWNELQEKATDRKAALMSSYDYHNCIGMVRDLLAWSSGLRKTFTTEEKVSDTASALMLKTEHGNPKA